MTLSAVIVMSERSIVLVFRALFGAFFYSSYIVLLRRKVNHEDNMDAPMFFGFVGLFNAIFLWPGYFGNDKIILPWDNNVFGHNLAK
jgi:solute carrier family 35 protein F5